MSNENFETVIDSDGKSHQILRDRTKKQLADRPFAARPPC
jgi:hypothetical protein